jgi:hypothetical protein
MAIGVQGASGTALEINPSTKAIRASPYPIEGAAHYRFSATSGLMTGIAAGAGTAGHVGAFRNTHASIKLIIQFVRLRFLLTTAFTAAQELRFALFVLRNYTSGHSGGSAISPSGTGGLKKATAYTDSNVTAINLASTAALTAGTHNVDSAEMMSLHLWAGAAGAGDTREAVLDMMGTPEGPIVLGQNEGLLIRNEVLWGAAGVGRLTWDMAWTESATYP